MAFAVSTSFLSHERAIHGSRAAMLLAYIDLIRELDEREHWALIVTKAKEAGLRKEDLCLELSCSWSTITRWAAGQTAPGPFGRRNVKAKLIEMLGSYQEQETRSADMLEYA